MSTSPGEHPHIPQIDAMRSGLAVDLMVEQRNRAASHIVALSNIFLRAQLAHQTDITTRRQDTQRLWVTSAQTPDTKLVRGMARAHTILFIDPNAAPSGMQRRMRVYVPTPDQFDATNRDAIAELPTSPTVFIERYEKQLQGRVHYLGRYALNSEFQYSYNLPASREQDDPFESSWGYPLNDIAPPLQTVVQMEVDMIGWDYRQQRITSDGKDNIDI